VVQNSAFYDLGGGGVILGRIANGPETDSNVPQFGTLQNNIVQGYGRVFPGAGAIALLIGHDMTFVHNDVNDGYSQGIMVCFPDATRMCTGAFNSHGAYNVSANYNHVWNLGQGILNDFGGVYYATYAATGGVIIGNKIHDFSDATASGDADGYGGNGIYLDRGGPITAKNNLVYRVMNGVSITTGPTKTGQIVSLDNNILAYSRKSVIGVFQCPKNGYTQFSFATNIVYQDRTFKSVPGTAIQNGMSYLGSPVASVQAFSSNDYWNKTENFSTDNNAFYSQNSSCLSSVKYDLAAWQALGEDQGSLSVDPGFTNPNYPADDYSFASAPPSTGFVPFNTSGTCATCPGRNLPVLKPPTVPESFPTSPFAVSAF
jgi:hypothetical protein